MTRWHEQYLGLPWRAHATGPDAYDCWGLVVHCLREHFGVVVGRHAGVVSGDHRAMQGAIDREVIAGLWPVTAAQEGSVVLMSRRRVFHHIGLFVAGGVLHARDGADICHESIVNIQRSGVQRFEIRTHARLLARAAEPVGMD